MIGLILKSYFSILFAVAASCLSILFLGVYYILRRNIREVRATSQPAALVAAMSVTEDDMRDTDFGAIAGDDVLATQLDLAKAFIEAGRKQFAEPILQDILKAGNQSQQHEARLLMAQL